MGSFKGLKQVRRIVEDCIQNIQHPIYHIKVSALTNNYINIYSFCTFLDKTSGVDDLPFLCLCVRIGTSRSFWWSENLQKIQHLLMTTGIGFFLNLRSMELTIIRHFLNFFFIFIEWDNHMLSYSMGYYLLIVYVLYSGKMLSKRRWRVKRRSHTHLSLLLNRPVRWVKIEDLSVHLYSIPSKHAVFQPLLRFLMFS